MFTSHQKIACALALLASAPWLAHAADPSTLTVPVHFADLNLSSSAGQEALHQRIQQAADSACGGRPSAHDLQDWQSFLACRDKAVAEVEPRINQAIAAAKQDGVQIAAESGQDKQ